MELLCGLKEADVSKVVYIKSEKCILIEKKIVKIGDIADIRSFDETMIKDIREIIIYNFEGKKTDRYVMSVMDIIIAIQNKYEDAIIINIGESDFIIEYNTKNSEKIWLEVLKVAIIGVIVFFGAAFAIMSFHEDVGMSDLFEDIYKLIMGNEKESVPVIEVTYSIGLFLGILIFYNRFGRKQSLNDPSPLEMEMKTYEDTVNDTLIMAGDRGESG